MKTWILAVSGGVDSVVMLHKMSQQPERRYVIAHVDHGIRPESAKDAAFVQQLAAQYGYRFETVRYELGQGASEDAARAKRWEFLRKVRQKYDAEVIVTGHHADDVVETMIINLMRGTGWRGLVSMREHAGLRRPLLGTRKREILDYAAAHSLEWKEDATNADVAYLRNHIRHQIIARCSDELFERFMRLYDDTLQLSHQIDSELQPLASGEMSRYELTMWPDKVAREVLRASVGPLPRREMDRLLLFARTARPHKTKQVSGGQQLRTTVKRLIVIRGDS